MALYLGLEPEDEPIGVINTTPLVDVMLVLLIIFLITIPVVTTSIKVNLPRENAAVRETKPENVIISVDRSGQVFVFDSRVKDSRDLQLRLKTFAHKQPQPEVQIRGDAQSDFAQVGKVLNAVRQAGIAKVAFITEPH
jgi:biopolymer transport protein ExbD